MGKRSWTGVFAVLGMLLLILDSKTALNGAREGLEMCLYTVIPALFPFFVLSGILTGVVAGVNFGAFRSLGRFCGIPAGTEGVFLIGMLGGYPTGARSIHQLWQQGKLPSAQARRMLGFCSNAGPSFLFGICAGLFPSLGYVWLLWFVHILSALFVARILPNAGERCEVAFSGSTIGVAEALRQALSAMSAVCGWVVVFRVLLSFLGKWGVIHVPGVMLTGLLELTNGCILLGGIDSVALRFLLCGVFLAFGGVCVLLQTVSVTGKMGLGSYLPGKLLQAQVSAFLCVIAQYFLVPKSARVPFSEALMLILGVSSGVTVYFLRKKTKLQ